MTRLPGLACLVLLAGCNFFDQPRIDDFVAGEGGTFAYSAMTNTVLTANDDGVAERLRRDWLAERLHERSMCQAGFVIDTRRYEVAANGPYGADGGKIDYQGHCM